MMQRIDEWTWVTGLGLLTLMMVIVWGTGLGIICLHCWLSDRMAA